VKNLVANREPKPSWTLSESAFTKFLSWLDQGQDSQGHTYLDIRNRLVAYFDRKHCLNPDELVDETLNRVARRLEQEGKIESDSPLKFCYTIARYVFLESLRSADSKTTVLKNDFASGNSLNSDEASTKELRLNCLETCCGKLEPHSRDLIIRYYYGMEQVKISNRRMLAKSLRISMNALSIRACRIRSQLEECVRKCVA
jgi:DNA-directed RNA polymerase specialized sigma24 family protein